MSSIALIERFEARKCSDVLHGQYDDFIVLMNYDSKTMSIHFVLVDFHTTNLADNNMSKGDAKHRVDSLIAEDQWLEPHRDVLKNRFVLLLIVYSD